FKQTLGSLAGAGDVRMGGTSATAALLLAGNNNTSTVFSGRLTGTNASVLGSLGKIGAGTLNLAGPSGSNNYSGTTQVFGGVLQLGASEQVPDTSALTIAGGATFALNGFNETIASLSGAGSVTFGAGSATLT